MNEKENLKKELNEIAPGLEKLRGNNPFAVPEKYFDTLPQEINEKVTAKSKAQNWVPVFFNAPRLVFSGITVLLILFSGYFLLFNSTSDELNGFADETYFESNMAWYAEYQADVYYDIILDDTSQEELYEELDEEQIIDYLTDYGYYMTNEPIDMGEATSEQ